jgi:hypothetical protein
MGYGAGDVTADYTVTNETTGAGYFSNVDIDVSAEAALVTTETSNVVVSSPRVGESQLTIDWDANWSGSGSYTWPTFILSTAKVLLVDGGTSTLDSSESQSNGFGDLNWTPQREYLSVKIRVEDNTYGDFAESSSFNVANPLSFSILGPDERDAGQQGTWSTVVSGGTSPYAYDWDYKLLCNSQGIEYRVEQCDTWYQGGFGSSWSHSLSGAEFDLKIRLTVADSDSPSYSKVIYKVVDILDI